MSVAEMKFACESCGKKFKWKPEIAGKKAKCACGKVLVVPKEMTPPEDELPSLMDLDGDTYDTNDEPAAPVSKPKPRAAAAPAPSSRIAGLPQKAAGTKAKEKKPLNWNGAFPVLAGGVLIIGYTVYLIINPHDPAEDDGYRVKWYKRLLNILYSVGGHWVAVGVLVLIALGVLYLGYLILKGGVSDDD